MAALLDLTPDTGTPVLGDVADLHTLLDQLHSRAWGGSEMGGVLSTAVVEVDRALRRLSALKLKLLAAADQAQVATASGYTGTDAWAARQTTTPRARAARDVRLAGELAAGHDATAQALDAGLLSPEHAAVIVHATDHLPAGVTAAQRDEVEAVLVQDARRFDPDQLRRHARRALQTIEPDQSVVDAHENELLHDEEQAAHAKATFSMRDNHDGTTTGHFTIPTLAAALLAKVLDTLTAPRRMRQTGPESPTEHGFDWSHRRGLAFTEILEHLPTDHLHPKTAATLVITLDHDTLQGALKAAGLDTGGQLTASETRRLACTAGLIPAVLGGRSVPLDLGRESRLFQPAQRLALGLLHHTCAADGCARPYAWCELHHHTPWARGGRTDLTNAVPLCHWHHQRIHDHHYGHEWRPDGTVRFGRRT